MIGALDHEPRRVVLDVSVGAFARPEEFVRAQDVFLIPQIYACETATSKRKDRDISAFTKWLVRHRDRIELARTWADMANKDRSPSKPCQRADIIDVDRTTLLKATTQPGIFEEELSNPSQAVLDSYSAHRHNFLQVMKTLETLWQEMLDQKLDLGIEWESASDNERAEYVWAWNGIPGIALKIVETTNGQVCEQRYAAESWQAALLKSPKRFAIGRWVAIMLWYMLVFKLDPDRRRCDDNSAEDAHYLFTASYSGFLATKDKLLGRSARALFGIQVFDSPMVQ